MREFLFILTAGVAGLFFSGCGYYPAYIDGSSSLWAPGASKEPEYDVTADAARCVERLIAIRWHGRFLEFRSGAPVDDAVLRRLKSARDVDEIGFSGLSVWNASACSSENLCDVFEWPGLTYVIFSGARFDAAVTPKFSPSLTGVHFEKCGELPSHFWAHLADSHVTRVSFPVTSSMLDRPGLLQGVSAADPVVYDLEPVDDAAREKLFDRVRELRKNGETRRYLWTDANRCVSAVP